MSKKRRQDDMVLNSDEIIIHEQAITETLETNYMPYAMSVIVSRAIPEIDGFKPSHRKLLYTMYKMGLLRGNKTKSANIVGQTMKLNPHGDQTIYDTMVRLTRGNEALLHPYIDSKGNMGKQFSKNMQYAAPRYTEAKLDKLAEELFKDIDKDVVDFVPNYDGSMEEPTLLPVTFPSVLVNANQGIAVGMASNICPFNLAEVCRTTIAYIKDPAVDVLEIMPAPDFPGGADLIYDEEKMREIYETGRGSFKLRAKYRVDKKNNLIEIYEIPYTTTVEAIIDAIVDKVKSGEIKEINDIRDETDLQGLKITIDCKRNTDYDLLMQKLYKSTPMESSFACNFNILINGYPRTLGVRNIIAEWLVFRRVTVKRAKQDSLSEKDSKRHLLRGLEAILLDIDKAISIIRNTEKEADVIPNLCAGFDIDKLQAEYVAEIKLRNLNKEYILKRVSEIENLDKDIAELEKIIKSAKLIDKVIIKELEQVIKNYSQTRRTTIIAEENIEEYVEEEFIDDFNLKVFLTDHGYLKKMALTSLRSAGDLKLKDNDKIIQVEQGTNADLLFCFSTAGNLYRIAMDDLEDNKPSDWGNYLPSTLDLDPDESIFFVVLYGGDRENYTGEIMVASQNGRVSKIALSEYETKSRRRKILNAINVKKPPIGAVYLKPGKTDPENPYEREDLELMLFADDQNEFAIINDQEQMLIFSADDVELVNSRSNLGTRIQKLKRNSSSTVFKPIINLEIEDPDYYRVKTFPQNGRYLRGEKKLAKQVGIEDMK